nr:MAG TPA: SmpA / OmlA family [Bacteriophage sp.]
MKNLILAAVVAAGLAGCAGTNFNWNNARQIKEGMSEQQVLTLLGKPNMTTSTPNGLIYVWSFANGFTGTARSVSVIMKDGVVVSAPSIPDSY